MERVKDLLRSCERIEMPEHLAAGMKDTAGLLNRLVAAEKCADEYRRLNLDSDPKASLTQKKLFMAWRKATGNA